MQLTDAPTFERHESSKAVVSNNRGALEELRSKRELNRRLKELEAANEHLTSQLNRITTMLNTLLEKHA